MFGNFKRKTDFNALPANPGLGTIFKAAFANENRSWTEEVDLIRLAVIACERRGHGVSKKKAWLVHRDSQFTIIPQIVHAKPLNAGGVQTTTTIQVHHPWLIPSGVFEFQHSAGDSLADSISKGIDQWLQTDLVALLDALRSKAETCTTMEMRCPAKDGSAGLFRRAVLGPVSHLMAEAPKDGEGDSTDEHPFCPCCLLTRSFRAFKELFEDDAFYGLRLFSSRDADGRPQADCRVNGEDWERGAQALREYAETWPPAGFEFRKQYVVLQSLDPAEADG